MLLMRRAGSGYRDGQLGLPAGHLDGNEDLVIALVRELREELGIIVDGRDVRLEVVLHSRAEDETDSDYLHLFFRVARWVATQPSPSPASAPSWSGRSRTNCRPTRSTTSPSRSRLSAWGNRWFYSAGRRPCSRAQA